MVSFPTPFTQCFSDKALNFSSLKDKCQDYEDRFFTNVVLGTINLYTITGHESLFKRLAGFSLSYFLLGFLQSYF